MKSPLRATEVIDWRELAECKGWAEKGVDPWFPDHPGEVDAYTTARKICAGCPVARQCLEAQMVEERTKPAGQRHGMFAGLKPEERYNLYRRRAREAAKEREEAA